MEEPHASAEVHLCDLITRQTYTGALLISTSCRCQPGSPARLHLRCVVMFVFHRCRTQRGSNKGIFLLCNTENFTQASQPKFMSKDISHLGVAKFCKPQTCLKLKAFVFPPKLTGCLIRILHSAPRLRSVWFLPPCSAVSAANATAASGLPFPHLYPLRYKGICEARDLCRGNPTYLHGGKEKHQGISKNWHFSTLCSIISVSLSPTACHKPGEVVQWEMKAEKCKLSRANPNNRFHNPKLPAQSPHPIHGQLSDSYDKKLQGLQI